jgi:hypothetical protein
VIRSQPSSVTSTTELEPEAVPEEMGKPLGQRRPVGVQPPGVEAGLGEDGAPDGVELVPADAGAHGCDHRLLHLAHELVPGDELVGRLADAGRPGPRP